MEEQTYKAWWPLHLRAAKGEALSAAEQAIYAEGKQRLNEEEASESDMALLRQTRAEIEALEAERERLQERRQQLRERARVLEAALSDSAKRTLGVGN